MRTIKNILLFSVISLAILFILEIYMSGAKILGNYIYIRDNKLGIANIPNNKIIVYNEGIGINSINSYGFIGNESNLEKSSDIVRIAILGDSFVESSQVFFRQHFVTISENRLNYSNNSVKFQVLNFGISGVNFEDMYKRYKNFAINFSPDIVLIYISDEDLYSESLYNKKKIENTVFFFERENDKINFYIYQKLFFAFNISHQNELSFILNRAYLLLLDKMKNNLVNGQLYPILFDKFYELVRDKKNTVQVKDTKTVSQASKKILEKLKLDKKVCIVYRDTISKHTDSIIRQTGLRIIDLNDTLNAMKNNNIDPNYWKATKMHGHWNYAAHKAVGIYLARKINELCKD